MTQNKSSLLLPKMRVIWALVGILSMASGLINSRGQNTPAVTPPSLLVFPPGVTLQTASNGELSTAVKAAIFQHGDQAPAIVSEAIAEIAKGDRLIPQKVPAVAQDATITAILVKKGQKVTAGQILAILDVHGKSMKYTATADGVIRSLDISEDMTKLTSNSLAMIAQPPENSLSAIRQVILAAAIASPSSMPEIVAAAAKAAPTVTGVISGAAQEALPTQSDAIAKAVPPVVPAQFPKDVPTAGVNQPPSSNAEQEIKNQLNALKSEGKLGDPDQVKAAVQKVMKNHTETREIPAPLGAKVIAIHKHVGEVVHKGDKILTLRLSDGSKLPILAMADGVMQELRVSKGGLIGNASPSSASLGTPINQRSVVILITMITG